MMKAKYLKWATEEDFNTWHTSVCEALNLPNEETKTDDYTQFKKHPNNNTGICAISPDLPGYLIVGYELFEDKNLSEFLSTHDRP